MRANIPTDNDFRVAQPVNDESESTKITKEQIELAKIGSSPQWSIIKDYLDARIEAYKVGLFGEDLSGVDTSVIGQRFLASQSVISELTNLKNEIETTTETVKEVMGDEELRQK